MGKTKTKIIDDSLQTDDRKSKVEDSTLKIEDRQIDNPSSTLNLQNSTINPQSSTVTKTKVSKRAQKKTAGKPKTRGKKYQKAKDKVERVKRYPLGDAIKLAQETSYSKFTGTIEIHINTASKNVRGLVTLPYVAGKKLTVLAFGRDADKSGADIVGTDETIAQIEKNKIDFDVVVTTPEWMPKLSKAARILGPKGLMPNPKNGTITDNLAKAVADLQGGKTEYKTEPNGQVIHLGVGKVDQNAEEIGANVKALYNTIGRSKVKKITLSPSMGPGVKVDLSSI